MTWPTPSEALAHDACALCLGDGRTFDLVLGEPRACSACDGSGQAQDMYAHLCDDPRCPDHG
jgi:DnaJ-class molecular chaperone